MSGRVVEQQQHLLPGQVIPPPRRPRLQAGRDLRRPDPGGQQQAGQRVGRVHRPLPRRVRVQRQEKLPVRESAGQSVRRVHRQCRLADSRHPADRVDPHHAAGPAGPPPAAAAAVTAPASCASSAARPVKLAISRGSVRVAAPPRRPRRPAPAPAGSRPRAAASNSARCGPERPSAPASSRAVSWRAVRFTPRSRSLTDRGDRRAASASSSCVSPASSRSRRSSPPKLSAGSATGPIAPHHTPSAGHRGRPAAARTGPCRPAYSCGFPVADMCGDRPGQQAAWLSTAGGSRPQMRRRPGRDNRRASDLRAGAAQRGGG